MFQRRLQQSYSGVDTTGEQHILTVLRFHEARLGKIEKHLINTNKQLQLIVQKQQSPSTVTTQVTSTNSESFTLLKNMMTNLTEQVVVSQSFMKEIKEVIGNLKADKVEPDVIQKPTVALNISDENTHDKLLELERNIAKASIIGIGMEPTLGRIDEYVERNRRDRKRYLNDLVEDYSKKDEGEDTSEDEEAIDDNLVVSHSIVDDAVLENNLIALTNIKSHVEEEVQDEMNKIPVIIKPKKKRRGRQKKT